jgi:hypothetical protein
VQKLGKLLQWRERVELRRAEHVCDPSVLVEHVRRVVYVFVRRIGHGKPGETILPIVIVDRHRAHVDRITTEDPRRGLQSRPLGVIEGRNPAHVSDRRYQASPADLDRIRSIDGATRKIFVPSEAITTGNDEPIAKAAFVEGSTRRTGRGLPAWSVRMISVATRVPDQKIGRVASSHRHVGEGIRAAGIDRGDVTGRVVLSSPPPETVAIFVTDDGASGATVTVSVIGG